VGRGVCIGWYLKAANAENLKSEVCEDLLLRVNFFSRLLAGEFQRFRFRLYPL
jgi:hypothetical protein